MKRIILVYTLLGLIYSFTLVSCQKKEQISTNNKNQKIDLKNYLKIPVDTDISLLIGELVSTYENINEDFKIIKKRDTIYLTKQFLESDNIDGKKIILESNHKFSITTKYDVGYNFSGDEKNSNYLPINHVIQQDIYSNLTIPSFDKIYHNDTFQKFEKLNKQEIYEESFNTFLKYYENKSENELKSCCPSDFKNYQKIKDIDPKNIYQLDLSKDLITYPDYKSITIDLKDINTNKNYVIKFIKEENKLQDNLNQINNTLNNSNQSSSWEGIYWLYPYNLDSKKIGNYYINIFNQNKEFGFSGDGEFNYKISTKIIDDNKLYIFDLNSQSSNPIAIIYKNQNKYYLKSSLIKIERSDLKETQNGYPINWAKSSNDVPDSPQ